MRLVTSPISSLLIVAALLGCGAGGASSTERATAPLEPTVRDSAGVTIHEHPADALDRAPLIELDSVPMAVIGGPEIEDDVTRLIGLAVLSDGRVAGYDAQSGVVKLYSEEGELLASWGARGEGPNEFRAVDQLRVLEGDSLAASDWVAGRLTVLHPDTGIIRQETVPLRGNRQMFTVAGRLTTGEWVVAPGGATLAFRTAGAEADTTTPLVPIGAVASGGGDHFDTLVVHLGPRSQRYMQQMRGNAELMEGPPRYSVHPIGTAWAGFAVALPNDRWQLERYDAHGALRSIIRAPVQRIAITQELKDSMTAQNLARYREQLAASLRRDQMPSVEEVEYNLRNAAYADSLPHFGQAHSTGGRTIWLSDYPATPVDSVRYTALDADGTILGRLVLPPLSRVAGFGDDRLLLRQEDDDGIITFAVHRLRMP